MVRSWRSLVLFVSLFCVIAAGRSGAADPGAPPDDWQGWSVAQRIAWYTASQGSRLIPQAWLHALEQPEAAAPFLDPAYIASFRYLPNPAAGWTSPDASCPYDTSLPLGFAVDCQSDDDLSFTRLRWKGGQSDKEPWVGMNCSACHTAELTYKGTRIRVDGGPTLADFQSFTESLSAALHQTASDPAKFGRFAAAVLGPAATDADKLMLTSALASWLAWNDKLDRLNVQGGLRYGFGRLDAVGHIFNKVSLLATPNSIAHQTANPSDAPTSYPFLWNVPQLDKVQWDGFVTDGVAGNFRYGAIGRNIGEVVGVFGDIQIKKDPGLINGGYTSSVNVENLNGMESQLSSLLPPKWPDLFPPIDQVRADAGGKLFAQRCAGCHTVPSQWGNLTEQFKVTLQPVFPLAGQKLPPTGTDFWMACNALMDSAASGLFAGNKASIITGDPIPDPSPSLPLLSNAVIGVMFDHKIDIAKMLIFASSGLPTPSAAIFAAGVNQKQVRADRCTHYVDNPADPKMVYKGRPLQGIWATAPYLHNGSIPNLWQLLLPAAQRTASFPLGTREFDPKEVGYVTTPSPDSSFTFMVRDQNGVPLDGNSNAGHDYNNAGFSDDDRWDLIEYMKTL